ncbi:MAG: hypothetical protein IKO55_10290 [Kiritimatiellae bacterium]|nr:hypothetical protein [Kiritimatiellia bacterium]
MSKPETIDDLLVDIRRWEKNAQEFKDLKTGDYCCDLLTGTGLARLLNSIAARLELIKERVTYCAPANPSPGGGNFRKFLTYEKLGIEFKRFVAKDVTKLVAKWCNTNDSHIYEITVRRAGDSANCGWIALATNDGHRVFELRSRNRSNAEHCAISAMKRYLARGHKKTLRALREAQAKEPTDEKTEKAKADM